MLTRILLCICTLSFAAFSQLPPIEPGVSQELAKWRAARYSNISYKLNLTLEKMSPVLKGTIEIRLKYVLQSCTGECPDRYIVLDWRKIRGSENLSTIKNVSINGRPASLLPAGEDSRGSGFRVRFDGSGNLVPDTPPVRYEEHNEHLIFREGIIDGFHGEENVIKLDFTSPILTSGSAITRYVDKEDGAEYIYSLFVPSDASTAFPVFDQPDLKARFSLTVRAPNEWEVVTNSPQTYEQRLIDSAKPPDDIKLSKLRVFAETKPISTYVFAFAAGPFVEVSEPGAIATGFPGAKNPVAIAPGSDKTPTSIFIRKSQSAKFKPHAAEVFRLNREATKYLETYFDYKFPFPKYDLVLIPEFPFGGMEHAGATFLREQSVIFPQEPTRNDIITRANLIFHEAAHQWFGDTVTMKWFDDLWLKEGFAEFMAYKTLEKVMPEANAWKVFYERNKRAAYATDSTKGTTPIYQPIANLSAAKSAYGNIVYRKAPSFLRQAEFYLGEQKFQTAVRVFLKKHEFANATWQDLVTELENTRPPGTAKADIGEPYTDIQSWANQWVTVPGVPILRTLMLRGVSGGCFSFGLIQTTNGAEHGNWKMRLKPLIRFANGTKWDENFFLIPPGSGTGACDSIENSEILFFFPNYQDYGYGIFLLDDKSRDYVLKNIQNEKDDFLRTMMWGSLWDSVREAELDPKDYVELVIKNITLEKDEGTIQTLLSRVTTAMNYYVSEPPALADGQKRTQKATTWPPAHAGGSGLRSRLENLLIDKIQNASTQGQRITYYRAFLNIASTDKARGILKRILNAANPKLTLKAKDKFDIVTRLAILDDPDAPKLLADLEKTETSDDAKRYAYAARAAFRTAENKAKFWNDFINNKTISESWIEAAAGTFNSIEHSDALLPYVEKALAELPKLKRERKIFFVNDWLADFIGGQRDEKALAIINKFLTDNPNLDNDLRLKILENSDLLERAVKIRAKFRK